MIVKRLFSIGYAILSLESLLEPIFGLLPANIEYFFGLKNLHFFQKIQKSHYIFSLPSDPFYHTL